jgi:integrase/recombinase XerD
LRKSLDEFLVFLAVEKGSSANTIAAYRNDLQQLADFIGSKGDRDGWRSLTRSDIQDFILHLKDRGYTETSVARKVAAVRSFFAFLAAEGVLGSKPSPPMRSTSFWSNQPGAPLRRRDAIGRCWSCCTRPACASRRSSRWI